MKCLGIHLGSIEMSTQPLTSTKHRLRWNKKQPHCSQKRRCFIIPTKGLKCFQDVESKTSIRCFHSLPWLLQVSLSALWVPCSIPLCVWSSDLFSGWTITSLIFIHHTWYFVCVFSIFPITDIPGRWCYVEYAKKLDPKCRHGQTGQLEGETKAGCWG